MAALVVYASRAQEFGWILAVATGMNVAMYLLARTRYYRWPAIFLVVAAPLTPRTRHLVDTRALARIKPGCRLVNISRGSVVDERAVAAALALLCLLAVPAAAAAAAVQTPDGNLEFKEGKDAGGGKGFVYGASTVAVAGLLLGPVGAGDSLAAADATFTGNGGYFGAAVVIAGDWNGDSYDDVVVGVVVVVVVVGVVVEA